jgi:hypothetical protein
MKRDRGEAKFDVGRVCREAWRLGYSLGASHI